MRFLADTNIFIYYTTAYANLSLCHNDPSDHVIIAQAITMKIPLISDDDKFPFYRNQGLELIENRSPYADLRSNSTMTASVKTLVALRIYARAREHKNNNIANNN